MMAVIINNLRQDLTGSHFDLIADVTFAGIKRTVVINRFGNAKKFYDAFPSFDSFAVMMLAPAMLAGESLVVEGEMDETLLFHMQGIVQDLLSAVVPKMSRVAVQAGARPAHPLVSTSTAESTAENHRVGSSQELPAATGFSGGVDSSYVISRCALKRDVPTSLQVGLLMHHNVGAFSSQTHYQQSLNHVQRWADANGLPLVGARCDMSHWYRGMTFLQTHTMRNVAAALSLGHLFSNFLYASGYDISSIVQLRSLDAIDSLNTILLPALQTGNNSFYLFGGECNRTDKSMYILADDSLNDSLNVCCRLQKKNHDFLNCGTCLKCCRCIMLAEAMGKVDRLAKTFDLVAFRGRRNRCMMNVLYRTFRPGGGTSNRVLVRYLVDNGYSFPAALRPVLKMAA